MAATAIDPSETDPCPYCGYPFSDRGEDPEGVMINNTDEAAQDRACCWLEQNEDGVPVIAVYFHTPADLQEPADSDRAAAIEELEADGRDLEERIFKYLRSQPDPVPAPIIQGAMMEPAGEIYDALDHLEDQDLVRELDDSTYVVPKQHP